VQLVVEATGVTDGLPVGVPPPEGGGVGPAVGAAGAFSLGGGQATFGFDKRPVGPVHFIVETTGITEIVTVPISPPQRSGSGSAVDTLSSF